MDIMFTAIPWWYMCLNLTQGQAQTILWHIGSFAIWLW